MINLLISPFLLLGGLLVTAAQAQEVSSTSAPVSATASAFQVIDDVRAENGDADLLYIQTTIARNEAAIEAAKTILKSSFDADVRMLAGDSLKSHDTELRALKAWLNLYGPKDTTPVAAQPVPAPQKPAVLAMPKPAAAVNPVAPVSPSLPAEPLPASHEVTITSPRTVSENQPPLPGSTLSMNPVKVPALPLLDVPPVPVSLTPVSQ